VCFFVSGPQVILNTMCEANQERFDEECPDDFQSASYLSGWGQLDMVMEDEANSQADIESLVGRVSALLLGGSGGSKTPAELQAAFGAKSVDVPSDIDMKVPFDYRNSVK
jgi:hypothetical protein